MSAPRHGEPGTHRDAGSPGHDTAGPHGHYSRQQAGPEDRFPGFGVMSQARHWDRVTAELVTSRLAAPPPLAFFHPAEQDGAGALLNLLAGQQDEPGIPVLEMVDARLAAGATDGWRYADMPEDGQAWRDTLAYLDDDATRRCGTTFAAAPRTDQMALIQGVQDLKSGDWHGLSAAHVWSLWTRYACTALYADPHAWDEIGFPGPAYPRGYKNAGVGKREPFEVPDARPARDPVREGA